MKHLREKTMEVQDLSLNIDELQGKNDQLELMVRKIDSYSKDVFEGAKSGKTIQQLTKEIQEKVVALEAFPRKNRHCVEWFDKYSAKHQELKKKFEDQLETE